MFDLVEHGLDLYGLFHSNVDSKGGIFLCYHCGCRESFCGVILGGVKSGFMGRAGDWPVFKNK